MMIRLPPLVLVFTLAACATAAPPVQQDTVTLALGQTGSAGGARLTPLSIAEDSRCPAAALCVTSGTARVNTRIETAKGSLTVAVGLQQPQVVGGLCVRLEQVEPYPVQPDSIRPEQYRFSYLVRPLEGRCEYIPPARTG